MRLRHTAASHRNNFTAGPLTFPVPRIASRAGSLGHVMRKRTDFILGLRPWSPLSFLAAVLAIGLGVVFEQALLSLGLTLYFAGFVPAILIATLFAGVPAGLFAALATIPLVWWGFIPPHYEFNPLTSADYHGFAMFALASALAISFSRLYREALALRRN